MATIFGRSFGMRFVQTNFWSCPWHMRAGDLILNLTHLKPEIVSADFAMTKCVSLLLYRETLSIEMVYSILFVLLCVCVCE